MAFGPSTSTGIIGTDAFGTLNKITPATEAYAGAPTISLHSFVMFQCMFAVRRRWSRCSGCCRDAARGCSRCRGTQGVSYTN